MARYDVCAAPAKPCKACWCLICRRKSWAVCPIPPLHTTLCQQLQYYSCTRCRACMFWSLWRWHGMWIRYMLLWQGCFFRPSTWEGVPRAVEQYLSPINLIYTKYTEGLWTEEFSSAAQLGSQSCMYGWYIWQKRVLFFRECTLRDADLILRMKK